MKNLTLVLASLMLLGVGTACAQNESPVTVSPASVNLNYQIGGLNNEGAQQAVTLSTTGTAALPFMFGTPTVGSNPQNCNWIAVDPSSGMIPAGSSAQSTISYNCAAGLPAGAYSGAVPVAVAGGSLSTSSVPVNLLVSNSPLLFVPTAALNFIYELGMNPPAAQSVTPQSSAVSASAASGQMPITVSATTASGGSWLVVTPTGALSTGAPISVSVNPANLANLANLSGGTYTGTVTVSPAAGATAGNGAQTITVTLTVANGPSIQASGLYGAYSGPIPPPSLVPLTSLSFPYQIGQAAPAFQTVLLYSSTGDPLNYSAMSAEATCANVSWLTFGGNTSGVTAGLGQSMQFAVAVQNLASLPTGSCTGTITVNATNPATGNPALGSPLSIPVTLYLSDNPLLSIYAPFLGFTLPVGGSAAAYGIDVNSTQRGVNIGFTVSQTTSSGGNWLTASVPGSDQGQLVSISANPESLAAGTYNGTVTITATGSGVANSPLTIPVTLQLVPGALVLSASSLGFIYIPGGPAPAAQTVQVTSNVSANFGFNAVANSGTVGSGWLSVTPSSGITAGGSLSISVNGSGLSPGTYTGTVVVTSPNASNSPVPIQVTLTVYAGGISASPPPSAGLTFVYASGGSAPPAQTISVSKTPASLTLGAATSTINGGNWLSFQTVAGATASTFQLQVLVNPAGLGTGNYTGAITIMAPNASGSPIIYPVTLVVLSAVDIGASPAMLNFGYALNAPPPAAQTLQVSPQLIGATGPLIFPATASATTASGGNWLSVTQFANGNIPGTISVAVNPAGLAVGRYSGAIVITSADTTPLTVPVTLAVSAQGAPVITAVTNSASGLMGGVSPGEEVAIYGSNFGPSALVSAMPTGGAYPTTLSNTQVLFDGVPAPVIAVTNGQVNVMVPYAVSGRASTAVQISYFGLTSAASSYNVAAAVPAIYTLNQTGSGQGAILNQDFSANSISSPAAPGSVVEIFLTGEGITSPASVTGQLAPTNGTGLNTPVLPVTALVEGLPAQVLYAGSAPGLVYGVMQVNIQIPANAPTGNLFVLISVGTNNTQGGVTVAVR